VTAAHPAAGRLTVSFESPGAFHYPDRHGKTGMSDRTFAIFLALELACLLALYAGVG
jgi:hypothetical protein